MPYSIDTTVYWPNANKICNYHPCPGDAREADHTPLNCNNPTSRTTRLVWEHLGDVVEVVRRIEASNDYVQDIRKRHKNELLHNVMTGALGMPDYMSRYDGQWYIEVPRCSIEGVILLEALWCRDDVYLHTIEIAQKSNLKTLPGS